MFRYKNTILAACALMIAIAGFAQGTAPAKVMAGTPSAAPTNYLEVLMVVIAGLLVLVVWVLSNVLFMIAKKAVEVSKANKKIMMS